MDNKQALELMESMILLAKKHKVDVLKFDKIELVITKHDMPLVDMRDEKVAIEGKFETEDDILFHSSDV
jgi:hypothetical protein